MSWKGFQKGVGRTPQQLKQRFNRGDITKDEYFIDAELRFSDLEKETAKLRDESTKYFQSINSMMDHQIEFSQACEQLYKPISGRASDLSSYVDDVGNPEGIRACEEYQKLVQELKETLQPELELIKTNIVGPAEELMTIVKQARKWITKRNHKQLDYDKEKNKFKKLHDKPDRTAKEETEMYKVEGALEVAEKDFDELNEGLKAELTKLFEYERDFIQPLFQSFYYMQLNVFYTLHEKMQNIDIGYFDFTRDIEEAFQERRGEIQAQAEAIPIVKFKTTGNRPAGSKFGSRFAIENGRANSGASGGQFRSRFAIENSKGDDSSPGSPVPSNRRLTAGSQESPPPPYETNGDSGRSPSTSGNWSSLAHKKAAPPPPKPKPGRLSGVPTVETVTALYDYEAQAEGDLSFSAGDIIEIVQRTSNENEWWTGKIRTKQGQFPGNYVQLNS